MSAKDYSSISRLIISLSNLKMQLLSYNTLQIIIGTKDTCIACSFVFFTLPFLNLWVQSCRLLLITRERLGLAKWNSDKQFEIKKMLVSTTFQSNRSHDFGFTTRNLPQKFGEKNSLTQKRLKYGKQYFTCFKIPFHFCQPTFGHYEVFSFFFFST